MPHKNNAEKESSRKDLKDELVDKVNNLGFGESTSINLSDLLKQLEMPEDNQENQAKK